MVCGVAWVHLLISCPANSQWG